MSRSIPQTTALAKTERVSPAEAFGVSLIPGSSRPDYGRFYGHTPIKDFWRDVTGQTAKEAIAQLTRRTHHLECVITQLLRALDENFLAEMEANLEPVETQMEALRQTQIELGKLLQKSLEAGQRASAKAIAAVEALRSDQERILTAFEERLAADLADLPNQWRDDIARTIDELRQSADGANALLHGAESLAGSVARSIEDFEDGAQS